MASKQKGKRKRELSPETETDDEAAKSSSGVAARSSTDTLEFEDYIEWNKNHGAPIEFDESWTRGNEMAIFQVWSETEEQKAKMADNREAPLWASCLDLYKLAPVDCLPPELRNVGMDKSKAGTGEGNGVRWQKTLLEAFHTCIRLPPFEHSITFFHYAIRLARAKRLENQDGTRVELPRKNDIVFEEPRPRSFEEFWKVQHQILQKLADKGDKLNFTNREFVDHLTSATAGRAFLRTEKHTEFLDHLQFGQKRSDKGLLPSDFNAIANAWDVYAEENNLPAANEYRTKVGRGKIFTEQQDKLARQSGEVINLFPTRATLWKFKRAHELQQRREAEKARRAEDRDEIELQEVMPRSEASTTPRSETSARVITPETRGNNTVDGQSGSSVPPSTVSDRNQPHTEMATAIADNPSGASDFDLVKVEDDDQFPWQSGTQKIDLPQAVGDCESLCERDSCKEDGVLHQAKNCPYGCSVCGRRDH